MFALRRPLARAGLRFPRLSAPGPNRVRCFATDHLGTYCDEMENAKLAPGDESKRAFTYFALSGARFMYASAARLTVMKFVATISASADVLALASLECDIGGIAEGDTVTVKWRGKPVFVRHRTPDEIADAEAVDIKTLRDQETDAARVLKSEWLVVLGVCTHLGCVPLVNQGEYNGWFCPCHGSHYDTSARIRKGPAPLNLEVPPYKFIEGGSKLLYVKPPGRKSPGFGCLPHTVFSCSLGIIYKLHQLTAFPPPNLLSPESVDLSSTPANFPVCMGWGTWDALIIIPG